ncbi:MAG TPA: outer membrane beta-barrel protein, partial [Cyclobacteriaceae bacterium]
MKKIFLTVSLCALFAAGAMAQGMKGGIKAGLNLSNITGDVEGTSMRTAFHVGGFLNFSFSDALSLQPELLYNSVGAKMSEFYEEEEVEVEVEGTQVLNYLSIPINLIYSFGNFNVQAGPQVSFLM